MKPKPVSKPAPKPVIGSSILPNPAVQRWVPWAVWIVVIVTMLTVPLKIIQYGYRPPDDALRHAAKVVSGKAWPEILVMRSDLAMDPSPGWHAILGGIYHSSQCSTDGLVVFSVVSLMLLVCLSALPWLRRPEAWLAALLVAVVVAPKLILRLTFGRPFLVSMAILITLLFLWSRLGDERPKTGVLISTLLMFAAAAWIHGSWFLFALPVTAFFLTGMWRRAAWLGGCWLGGSFLGGVLTGHPVQFLLQSARWVYLTFGEHLLTRQLVVEYLPSGGDFAAVLVVAVVLIWRARSPDWKPQDLLSPIFLMIVVGWLLGLKVIRNWWDWGIPALVVWLGLELQKQCEHFLAWDSWKRLVITCGLAAGVYLGATSDYENRWTWNLGNQYLSEDNPSLTGWLPEPGGILYNTDLDVFYNTFYKNPKAPWRYALGFESILMPPDNLEVFRQVQLQFGNPQAYEPWVKKMRLQDRLVIPRSMSPAAGPPHIPELEWALALGNYWIGRTPHGTNNPPAAPPLK